MKLITAAERLAEVRGLSALMIGPTGVGKTSLVSTLSLETLGRTLYVDSEKGDFPIAHLQFDSVRLETWRDAMNLAAVIGGPNPALPPTSATRPRTTRRSPTSRTRRRSGCFAARLAGEFGFGRDGATGRKNCSGRKGEVHPHSPHSGMDNVVWVKFTRPSDEPTVFVFRDPQQTLDRA